MKLLIDSGNTRLKWQVLGEDGECLGEGVSGAQTARAVTLAQAVRRFGPQLRQIVIAHVAGAALAAEIRAELAPLPVQPLWVRAQAQGWGVTNGYAVAHQLGADRWAALVGARARRAVPWLVVMAGTATTVDMLDEHGYFHGGFILPGVNMMLRSLAENTAQLSDSPGEVCALPNNTQDAIASGCLYAQVGAIRQMFQTHLAHRAGAACLIGGGHGRLLAEHLDFPVEFVDHPVLSGLAVIAAQPSFSE